jgi:hypothetical protein
MTEETPEPDETRREKRQGRREERHERREERRGSDRRAELKARLIAWGHTYTQAQLDAGEVELEHVESAPEPPVGNQVVDQELEGDYTLSGGE